MATEERAPLSRIEDSASERTLEGFGYRQELKRSLGLAALVTYGLVFISPTSPISIFGVVYNLSHGMVPLVSVVGFIAMGFTAFSYVMMARAFPIAGSVYAYAARAIGVRAGFLAGWVMLLDYVLMPALVYVLFCAIAVQAVFPEVPRALTIVVILGFNTTINLLGIEATARLNTFWLAVSLGFVAVLVILALTSLARGVGGAHFSWAPLLQPATLAPGAIFAALSVATLNFLGFDGIATLGRRSARWSRGRGTGHRAQSVSCHRDLRTDDLSRLAFRTRPAEFCTRRTDRCSHLRYR